jgi:threonine/homoserine/homoserine lactone efflux protein
MHGGEGSAFGLRRVVPYLVGVVAGTTAVLLGVANPKAWVAIGAVFTSTRLADSAAADAAAKTAVLTAVIVVVHVALAVALLAATVLAFVRQPIRRPASSSSNLVAPARRTMASVTTSALVVRRASGLPAHAVRPLMVGKLFERTHTSSPCRRASGRLP